MEQVRGNSFGSLNQIAHQAVQYLARGLNVEFQKNTILYVEIEK